MERSNAITMKGKALTLVGPELRVGDRAPDFTLLDSQLQPVKLSDTSGSVRMFSVVPSLDTGVCNIQTVTFNNELAKLKGGAKVFTVSADLPFAQHRFGQEHKIERLQMLSDHRDLAFGNNYGLVIKELRLLARAVVVVGKDDRIKHMQIVPEVTNEPDYSTALAALKKAMEE